MIGGISNCHERTHANGGQMLLDLCDCKELCSSNPCFNVHLSTQELLGEKVFGWLYEVWMVRVCGKIGDGTISFGRRESCGFQNLREK